MEKLGQALTNFPQLAPAIIVCTLAGIGYGLYKDIKTDEFGNWWQLGGIGLVIGAFGGLVLAELS